MLLAHQKLSSASRAWIFQADRKLSEQEKTEVEKTLSAFCHEWCAHGTPLQTNFEIRENYFVILYVDESTHQASGCSIDGSTHVMKSLQEKLGIDFFGRTQIPVLIDGTLKTYPLREIKQGIATGVIAPQTLIFNTTAATKGDLEKAWKISLENSWLARFLPTHEGISLT